MEAHVEELIALSEEVDGHEILSEEEQHCPAPAGSLVADRTHFLPPSAHRFPASQSHRLLSRSMSAASSEPQAGATSQLRRLRLAPCVTSLLFGQNEVKLSSHKEANLAVTFVFACLNAKCWSSVSCKVLQFFHQYMLGCNYFWMLCEGIYLHTLIVVAVFAEEQRLHWYYLLGWGFPLVPASIHAVARARYFNDNCWMSVDTHLLYIVHGPVMAALLVNFFFLLNIVRVLVTKLRDTHRAESNMYMKAVRATLILVPLLGIQFVIIPWRPENRLAGEIYDYIMHILMHYQVCYCCGLASVGNEAPHSRSLTLRPQWGGGETRKSKSKKACGSGDGAGDVSVGTRRGLPVPPCRCAERPPGMPRGDSPGRAAPSQASSADLAEGLLTPLQYNLNPEGLLVATIFCFFNGENSGMDRLEGPQCPIRSSGDLWGSVLEGRVLRSAPEPWPMPSPVQGALKRQWTQYKTQWGQRRREHCSTRSTSYTATSITEVPIYLYHHDSNNEQLNGRYLEDSELVALKSGDTSA
ncbi:hypothetical protein QYF61_003452 [Mycteria americana]|uniref:G-protein coupled receptors family 2 profile 2 domain-containing protein n=1 Tax=Mycteria americana TaxID=33587 RepID=A0AAN7P3J1_MYCAM|nr:hypothetical protein QYF61_003452 [Mycteria americana]